MTAFPAAPKTRLVGRTYGRPALTIELQARPQASLQALSTAASIWTGRTSPMSPIAWNAQSTCRVPVGSRSRAASPRFTEPTHWLFSTIGKSRSRQRHRACRLVDDWVPLSLPLDLENWHLNTGLNAHQKRPVAARRGCQTSTCNTRMVEVLREPADDGWRFWLSRRSRHMIGGHSSSAL